MATKKKTAKKSGLASRAKLSDVKAPSESKMLEYFDTAMMLMRETVCNVVEQYSARRVSRYDTVREQEDCLHLYDLDDGTTIVADDVGDPMAVLRDGEVIAIPSYKHGERKDPDIYSGYFLGAMHDVFNRTLEGLDILDGNEHVGKGSGAKKKKSRRSAGALPGTVF